MLECCSATADLESMQTEHPLLQTHTVPTICVGFQSAGDALGHDVWSNVQVFQLGVASVGVHDECVLLHNALQTTHAKTPIPVNINTKMENTIKILINIHKNTHPCLHQQQ